ncbi:branched-chain amino acid ABC transporter permease [Desulfovibrio sp. OttesenSCG-928-G11]|nr:branched-chain amino acid ABC transporter permease [Desulfovibrio sp. OttesenSCG-928-G11]
MNSRSTREIACTGFAVALLFTALHFAELHLDAYNKQILSLIAINAILALSLNLIYGFTGMFSLGHAGFMAIGAYVCTLLILTPMQKEIMWILEEIHPALAKVCLPQMLSAFFSSQMASVNLGFLAAVLCGGLVAALFGLLIALPVLRLGGDYLGIATLGFAEIIRVVITNVTPLTNGSLGIKGIPQYATLWWNYAWLLFALYFVVMLLRSNVGNVLKAIRDDEIAARTMGVNTFFYRVLSFSIGAFFAGVGGALMAALISTIDPKMFNFMLTFNVLMIVVAGGLGSITGSIIGSVVITVMLEWLRIVESPISLFGFESSGVPGMRMVIFSLLLLGIILFRRQGLMGMREFSWHLFFGKGRRS